ncbi:putative Ig domain-containing protein, partial [Brucella anthropi]|uniref:putative Ig domain-containing protein n=1 Tax=Brucella anthropi TaxID=529 RepID=UPI00056342A6
LVIAAAPTIEIAPDALPAGKINQVYAETTLSVSGGTAPYTYKVEGLPEGLSLTGNKIAGTPTEARSFDVKVTATDKEGYEGNESDGRYHGVSESDGGSNRRTFHRCTNYNHARTVCRSHLDQT